MNRLWQRRGRVTGPRIAASSPVGPTDPYWSSVVLLANNENGANGSTSFTDASSKARTLTAVGNWAWSNAQAPTGLTTSAASDGSGDRLSAASSADFAFGTGDFTIETWVRFHVAGQQNFIDMRADGTSQLRPVIYKLGSSGLRYFLNGADRINGGASPALDTWLHVEVGRSSGNTKMFQDGTQVGSTFVDATDYPSAPFSMGASWDSSTSLNGFMAATRVTVGVCRHTTNFTPPTLPLPTS